MSYVNPGPPTAEELAKQGRQGLIFFAMLIVLFFIVVFKIIMEPPRYLKRIENADPYVLPQGCPNHRYVDGGREPVPSACMPLKYAIRDWYARGLKSASRTDKDSLFYYRIGNDAVGVTCSWTRKDDCWVTWVERDFFLVKAEAGSSENGE